MQKVKDFQYKENDVEFNRVSDAEKLLYAHCNKQLSNIIKEFEYEK
jgi:hypothetical protein